MFSSILYLWWKRCEDSKVYPAYFWRVFSAVHWGKSRWIWCCNIDRNTFLFSTLSSGLNSLAAVVLSDIIKFFYRREMTDKQDLWLSKILCKLPIVLSIIEKPWFSVGVRCDLYFNHLFGIITWKSSSSSPLTVRYSFGSDQRYIFYRIFSSLDQLDGIDQSICFSY